MFHRQVLIMTWPYSLLLFEMTLLCIGFAEDMTSLKAETFLLAACLRGGRGVLCMRRVRRRRRLLPLLLVVLLLVLLPRRRRLPRRLCSTAGKKCCFV
jgi:hypothetical protein